MTWGQFKKAVEADSRITSDSPIRLIDYDKLRDFDELTISKPIDVSDPEAGFMIANDLL